MLFSNNLDDDDGEEEDDDDVIGGRCLLFSKYGLNLHLQI